MDNSLKKGRITRYSNKIGLFDNDKQTFINASGDVVLSFPFKDCILEGGMSDEESGREEKFFHEILDRADIDTLRDPKVLTGFEKIDKDGIHTVTSPDTIDFWDENGELKENLLIKGNNLIALYSLRQKLAGKVKLIYIDPPYNTGSDGFRYNDSFNHSTWLVFMRNRLEIARELLREDGVIFVQCDDNEQAYLKVLMDEIFRKENFVGNMIWKKKRKASNLDSNIRSIHEYLLVYGKNKKEFQGLIYSLDEVESDKPYPFYNTGNKVGILSFPANFVRVSSLSDGEYKPMIFDDKKTTVELLDIIVIKDGLVRTPFRLKGEWRYSQKKLNEFIEKNEVIILKGDKFKPYWINNEERSKFAKTLLNEYPIGTNEDGDVELFELFGDKKIFNFPKPETLIQFVIDTGTSSKDIVLDYHLGSGTTSAVAHKMGRRWIGIEQMDYIEDIAKVRLQKVIRGEQGGISKSIEWQGGGSFVYMELKAYNIEFVERIESARTKEELHTVYVEMASNAFLQFWFDRRDWERDENYRTLPLEEQKVKLRELLDLNQLYLNVGDMNDSRHHVSALEKALTEKFYGKE